MKLTRQYITDLKTCECHDATWFDAAPPLVMSMAEGSLVRDVDGREYIDLCAGFGVLALGHHSALMRAHLQKYAATPLIVHGMGDVYPSDSKVRLLKLLSTKLGCSLTKGALAMTGGQAVEYAVKTALIASGKRGFITFAGSYHGLDLGILPLTSRGDFKRPFAGWIPEEQVNELSFGCDLSEVERTIDSLEKRLLGCAAILVEPIQGRAGVRPPPEGWLKGLSDLARRRQVLLIFDEIFTGLGRTGRMTFAREAPCDLICLGKALGSGFPISACFGRPEVMDAWPPNLGEAIHTGTFFGHPFICALACDTLEALDPLTVRSAAFGATMREGLRTRLFPRHPHLKEVRGDGMMIGLVFDTPGLGVTFSDRLRAEGVIALPAGQKGETLSVTPALNIDESLWERALDILANTPSD